MINLIRNILALGVIALAFTACSTMNKSECLTANWKTIGYGDGAGGHKVTRLAQHREACAEHGITPNMQAYNNGRHEGLKQYCVRSTAYNLGTSGSNYNGVCSKHKEGSFLEAYNYGKKVRLEANTLKSMQNDYDSRKNRISRLRGDISYNKDRLVRSKKLTPLDKYKMLEDNTKMDAEIRDLENSLDPLNDEIYRQSSRLDKLKANYNP